MRFGTQQSQSEIDCEIVETYRRTRIKMGSTGRW